LNYRPKLFFRNYKTNLIKCQPAYILLPHFKPPNPLYHLVKIPRVAGDFNYSASVVAIGVHFHYH